ncbi:DsbA family oxidoreductase [Solimonas soli]|uniref:DsbA family oxidoreductase n=1 Tax=Solimonas soli TaxID=413479 RepID=UPI000480F7AF|nr:DsbA family oxidoreductase [Solimonas soli]
MAKPIRIDFVSDVVCPWCAVGLASLNAALARLGDEVAVEIHYQPFELNPDLPEAGETIAEHLGRKYGMTPEQLKQNGQALVQRAASVGFTIDLDKRDRIYNTFDAHRLLHWAGTLGEKPQAALKLALLRAYHSEGRDVSDRDVLKNVAAEAGLDAAAAAQVLVSGQYASEVRADERFFLEQGIRSVPAVILDRQYLISGGQPPDVFEDALRQLAAQD